MLKDERAKELLKELGLVMDDGQPYYPEDLQACITFATQVQAEARLAGMEATQEGIRTHIKEYPNLGACEWNCTTVEHLHELVRKARLEEAKWWAENPKMCVNAEDCPECKMKAERIRALEALAGGESIGEKT
jgi:hypothetical protein